MAASPAVVVLKEVVVLGVLSKRPVCSAPVREGRRARKGRPQLMASTAVNDQEAPEIGPPLLAPFGAAPQIVSIIGGTTVVACPEAFPVGAPPSLNMCHASRPLRRIEGPSQETVRQKAETARQEKVADGLKIAIKTKHGSV